MSISELREAVKNILPPELDTEFNLQRWLRNYENNVSTAAAKFGEYIKNRRALGYDKPEALDNFYERPDVQTFCRLFSLSTLRGDWVNEKDNALIFVETGIGEPSKVVKAIRAGTYAEIFFGYCEYFQRLVLEREAASGKPSYGICIFDMKFMGMLHYGNPFAPINKLFQTRVNIWLDYYGELLKHVVILNPPKVMGVVFKMMKILLPERVIGRFSFIKHQPADILPHISIDAIPVAYGGKKQITDTALSNGCNMPKNVTNSDYLKNGAIWADHGISKVPYESFHVSSHHEVCFNGNAGQKFLYEYHASCEFEIVVEDDQGLWLLPSFRTTTPVLSNEGIVTLPNTGNFKFRFHNLSKIFTLKVNFAGMVI